MTEQLQEILNRKPSKWGNLTVKEFEGDIKLLQERVQELEELNRILSSDKSMFIEELVREQQQNKRYREARKELESLWNRTYEINANEYKGGRLDGLEIAMNIIDEALEREG